eukprot:430227_1
MRLFILYIWWIRLFLQFTACNSCSFRFGSIGIISGPPTSTDWSRAVAAAWKLAIQDYNTNELYDMQQISSHLQTMETSCNISIDMHDSNWLPGTDWRFAIKHAITEMFEMTQLYSVDRYINVPIILGQDGGIVPHTSFTQYMYIYNRNTALTMQILLT